MFFYDKVKVGNMKIVGSLNITLERPQRNDEQSLFWNGHVLSLKHFC